MLMRTPEGVLERRLERVPERVTERVTERVPVQGRLSLDQELQIGAKGWSRHRGSLCQGHLGFGAR